LCTAKTKSSKIAVKVLNSNNFKIFQFAYLKFWPTGLYIYIKFYEKSMFFIAFLWEFGNTKHLKK